MVPPPCFGGSWALDDRMGRHAVRGVRWTQALPSRSGSREFPSATGRSRSSRLPAVRGSENPALASSYRASLRGAERLSWDPSRRTSSSCASRDRGSFVSRETGSTPGRASCGTAPFGSSRLRTGRSNSRRTSFAASTTPRRRSGETGVYRSGQSRCSLGQNGPGSLDGQREAGPAHRLHAVDDEVQRSLQQDGGRRHREQPPSMDPVRLPPGHPPGCRRISGSSRGARARRRRAAPESK